MATNSTISVPDGFTLHTENNSHILLKSNEAFLNPVQEFNRDTSVACIRVWSEEFDRAKEAKWRQAKEKKAQKSKEGTAKKRKDHVPVEGDSDKADVAQPDTGSTLSSATEAPVHHPYKFVLLEALSATGLRSIRYAKEIPLVKYVIANDLSSSATEAMRRNIEINGLGPTSLESGSSAVGPSHSNAAKVRVNEGDACTLMYNHRAESSRVDVVDLDPYGTAGPFIDAAVQCVKDGGLLCVTCTDLGVLATANYPEKCFANYGGIPLKAEYCHEAALRLVLHSISTSATRYGRYIEPLLSLSIDFYVRIFVRVRTAAVEVKKVAMKTSTFYICTSCEAFYGQPLGRVVEKVHEASGNVNYNYKTHAGPPVSQRCPECDSTLHIAGPMWSAPIHDRDFVAKVLEHLDANQTQYGTFTRMKGMLTVAKEELDVPFYFTPAKMASFFHCVTPSLDDLASALLHAGHKISRSHACSGSLKTTATCHVVRDIYRSWVKSHPVKMENISDTSPTKRLLSKESAIEANFTRHPESASLISKVKLVRYQQNPTSNWGPATKAVSGSKRKRGKDE